jgi:hypothetical protein
MGCSGTNIEAWASIADRIRCDDPDLYGIGLAPDGKYQTVSLTMDRAAALVRQRLSAGFRGRHPDGFPSLQCAWSKARVGSTALGNLFGMAGIPSYFQPVKTVLRHVLMGTEADLWCPPDRAEVPAIFSKDVAGPYLLAECLYVPLQYLIEAGYPPDRLHLVMLDRAPEAALASWITKWSDRIDGPRLLAHFVLASLNAVRVEAYARRQGVAVTRYVYEASRDPALSARALFARLGLAARFCAEAVTDWRERGELESSHSPLIRAREPDVFFVPGLHAADTEYRFHQSSTRQVTDGQRAILAAYGIEDLYRTAVAGCIADLGFDPATAARLFGTCAPEIVPAA